MTEDLDPQLKQVFDERLSRFDAPTRRRRSHLWLRLAVGVATVSLILGGAAFATDVNAVAAANGAECAHAIAKLELWVRSHAGEPAARHQPVGGEHHLITIADAGCQGH
ncbi:MAG: hypothetical protein AUH39_01240 [Chloroflexi bacterium 13_1_40CM_67_9]|nr:MAG: hypothetical protein AUH39_01240 [Chloroflexi bacterium 13_1_40CM_67_9]